MWSLMTGSNSASTAMTLPTTISAWILVPSHVLDGRSTTVNASRIIHQVLDPKPFSMPKNAAPSQVKLSAQHPPHRSQRAGEAQAPCQPWDRACIADAYAAEVSRGRSARGRRACPCSAQRRRQAGGGAQLRGVPGLREPGRVRRRSSASDSDILRPRACCRGCRGSPPEDRPARLRTAAAAAISGATVDVVDDVLQQVVHGGRELGRTLRCTSSVARPWALMP